ncbi:acyltransferase [Capillimicrobium parvum]|uniref:2,3,4,5-tetrahydropyridine-2,6-dicarboxylate N-acetyltransferase n=1 Tax=Capillimicrobium parvum TaxID=2884022 RepID=A0A9E7C1U0_9ACTN|nr:2,3,4,5-tetrahydropyridine-2,6-dicarboxylate N-acetyltransferase [Capillimicrobium parvum]
MRTESLLPALQRRVLGALALYAPGAESVRVWLHRRRGVAIGQAVFIGTDVMIETAHPQLVHIGNRVEIGARTMIVAHQQGEPVRPGDVSVRIGDEAYIGPGAILLPHVTVGRGAVVHAGSVVTRSVAPLTMVRGNPAEPVARCGTPLRRDIPLRTFYRQLRPI